MNLIFAVTSKVLDVYKLLAERIPGASYGKLDKDSSNVVDLIKNEYQVSLYHDNLEESKL